MSDADRIDALDKRVQAQAVLLATLRTEMEWVQRRLESLKDVKEDLGWQQLEIAAIHERLRTLDRSLNAP